MLPMCAEMGVGCIPYSPQGKGRLTRRGGADPAFCQGCGCEDIRLDVTLTGAEIRMPEEPFTPQTPYWL
jgi:aryl-alcohol dehydrogenase-like predicted oxidoreductase